MRANTGRHDGRVPRSVARACNRLQVFGQHGRLVRLPPSAQRPATRTKMPWRMATAPRSAPDR